jgi:hypothetical protein
MSRRRTTAEALEAFHAAARRLVEDLRQTRGGRIVRRVTEWLDRHIGGAR